MYSPLREMQDCHSFTEIMNTQYSWYNYYAAAGFDAGNRSSGHNNWCGDFYARVMTISHGQRISDLDAKMMNLVTRVDDIHAVMETTNSTATESHKATEARASILENRIDFLQASLASQSAKLDKLIELQMQEHQSRIPVTDGMKFQDTFIEASTQTGRSYATSNQDLPRATVPSHSSSQHLAMGSTPLQPPPRSQQQMPTKQPESFLSPSSAFTAGHIPPPQQPAFPIPSTTSPQTHGAPLLPIFTQPSMSLNDIGPQMMQTANSIGPYQSFNPQFPSSFPQLLMHTTGDTPSTSFSAVSSNQDQTSKPRNQDPQLQTPTYQVHQKIASERRQLGDAIIDIDSPSKSEDLEKSSLKKTVNKKKRDSEKSDYFRKSPTSDDPRYNDKTDYSTHAQWQDDSKYYDVLRPVAGSEVDAFEIQLNSVEDTLHKFVLKDSPLMPFDPGLVQRIVQGDVPQAVRKRKLKSLDLQSITEAIHHHMLTLSSLQLGDKLDFSEGGNVRT